MAGNDAAATVVALSAQVTQFDGEALDAAFAHINNQTDLAQKPKSRIISVAGRNVVQHLELLKDITFGARVAEDETGELAKYFVETDQWSRIFKGEIDVIRGEKGSGKSAIYSLLVAREDELFDKSILLVTAEQPRGATVFRDLVADPPTSEQEFTSLWKLYIVALTAQKIKDLGIANDHAKKLLLILEDQGVLEKEFDLARTFKQVRTYVSRFFNAKSIEGSIAIDPNTLIPTVAGKITPGEPTTEERKSGFTSMDELASVANRALLTSGYTLWVLLDRLDVAFIESHDLEKNALRALFRVYRDFGNLDAIKLKIFLRTDIWNRIVEGGFRESSHITKVAVLDWTQGALLNLIIKRLLNNSALAKAFNVKRETILKSIDEQSKTFYRFFPQQVEQGPKKRNTLDWIISRCADATDKTAPREIIHLLNSARKSEISRLELGGRAPEHDQLFDRTVFKPALEAVSETRLIQTIYAEYSDLRSQIEALHGEKTEQTIDSLATIWRVPDAIAKDRAERLVEIGFFQVRGLREKPTYWVPFLYRDALNMSQGLAEEAD